MHKLKQPNAFIYNIQKVIQSFAPKNLFNVKICFSHMDCTLDLAHTHPFLTLPLHQSFAISRVGIDLTFSLFEFSSDKQRKEGSDLSPFTSPGNWHLVGIRDY